MTVWMFPGQGSQQRGMGAALFERFPRIAKSADRILGYSLRTLCLDDPDGLLARTDRTQPALFAVSAMQCMALREDGAAEPDAVIGHSLGEYVALFAAGAFDFETGLTLVRERGRLMNEAPSGGMLAVIGLERAAIDTALSEAGLGEIDVANINAPNQIVLSGPKRLMDEAARAFQDRGAMVIPLNVSAAFHSRQMSGVRESFARFLGTFEFSTPRIAVIANATARPYPQDGAAVRDLLARQIVAPVRWVDSIQYLLAKGQAEFREVGPGTVLAGLLARIKKVPVPPLDERAEAEKAQPKPAAAQAPAPRATSAAPASSKLSAMTLGSAAFRQDYGLDYAYVAGAMYKGIATPEMVMALSDAGMMGFLGVGGVPLATVEKNIATLSARLKDRRSWGVNLLCDPDDPESELAAAESYLRLGVRTIEASAFLHVTPSVVRFRFAGARRADDGRLEIPNRVIAKLSRPEVARQFLEPAAQDMVDTLVSRYLLTEEEAYCALRAPVASDISVESDSGGHTDQGSALALVPSIRTLRDRMAPHAGTPAVRIGAAGGIGTPDAILAALMLGADYVVTGSINQCTVEAGTSDAVKDILQALDIHDFAYAPAGDMFELGAQVQVVRKGTFFSGRANRLYDLYRTYESLESIPQSARQQIEQRFFARSLDDVWAETRAWLSRERPDLLARAETSPKYRMALVFRWYFFHTTEMALAGREDERVNFQIHSGPALGAFNSWVSGTELENWRQRRVADIGRRLMEAAAELAARRLFEMAA